MCNCCTLARTECYLCDSQMQRARVLRTRQASRSACLRGPHGPTIRAAAEAAETQGGSQGSFRAAVSLLPYGRWRSTALYRPACLLRAHDRASLRLVSLHPCLTVPRRLAAEQVRCKHVDFSIRALQVGAASQAGFTVIGLSATAAITERVSLLASEHDGEQRREQQMTH